MDSVSARTASFACLKCFQDPKFDSDKMFLQSVVITSKHHIRGNEGFSVLPRDTSARACILVESNLPLSLILEDNCSNHSEAIKLLNKVGPGFYPSVIHQLSVPDDPEQWDVDPSPSLTHTVEAMVKVKSMEQGRKYNLMAKVIPLYGFGVLLYILYIIHKLSCREKMNKSGMYSAVNMANVSKISSDYELARLQQRLLHAEMMMERIVSGKSNCSSRKWKSKISTSKKEEKLLRQIRQISLLMQESLLEGASPEMEAEEVPYGADWEGYPEETYPQYDSDRSYRRRFEKLRLEEPPSQPTAEALAERMEQEEEEIMARKLSIVQEEDEEEEDEEDNLKEGKEELDGGEEEAEDYVEAVEEDVKEEEEEEEEKKQLLSPASSAVERKQERLGLEVSRELQQHSGGKKQISFSDQKRIFHYPKEETFEEEEEEREDETEEDEEGTEVEETDDDDPLTEAESLRFSCEASSNPEEGAGEETEECLLTLAPVEGEGRLQADGPKNVEQSGLRMRNRRQT